MSVKHGAMQLEIGGTTGPADSVERVQLVDTETGGDVWYVPECMADSLQERVDELQALINSPHTADFLEAVKLEFAHQRERWGADHDAEKAPYDWVWLIAYLVTKAAVSADMGHRQKALHHTISSAAALLSWHTRLSSEAPVDG